MRILNKNKILIKNFGFKLSLDFRTIQDFHILDNYKIIKCKFYQI